MTHRPFDPSVQPAIATDVPVATPRVGVTKVGVLAKTAAPVPVSSVSADRKLADDGVPKNVATPVPSPADAMAERSAS